MLKREIWHGLKIIWSKAKIYTHIYIILAALKNYRSFSGVLDINHFTKVKAPVIVANMLAYPSRLTQHSVVFSFTWKCLLSVYHCKQSISHERSNTTTRYACNFVEQEIRRSWGNIRPTVVNGLALRTENMALLIYKDICLQLSSKCLLFTV